MLPDLDVPCPLPLGEVLDIACLSVVLCGPQSPFGSTGGMQASVIHSNSGDDPSSR